MNQALKIAVLYGGKSTEHEVSVHSAQTVCEILSAQPEKYKVIPVLIDKDGRWYLQNTCQEKQEQDLPVTPVVGGDAQLFSLDGTKRISADLFFPVLHGTNGEDGTIQGLFEIMNVPYAGCGVLTSALGMDKELTKLVAWKHGLPVLEYRRIMRGVLYDKKELASWVQKVGLPVFVKPVSLGSSVGVSKVKSLEELSFAVELALGFDEQVMVEKGVAPAREIFCALFGEGENVVSSGCGELKTVAGEFFDYNAKYLVQGGCETRVPADIPASLQEEIKKQSEILFKALRGQGLARVDYLLGTDGKCYFSEINTLPGMSHTSLFPQLFEASGHPYAEVLDGLIQLALARYQTRQNLCFERRA